jgi:uncharacterized protein (TIGR02246 family)
MKLLIAILIGAVSILVVLLAAQSGSSQSATSRDEAAVREVVRKYVDARDHPDPATLTPLFTKDADQLVSNGQWRKGREEVVRGSIASSQNETGKRTITVESVRFPAPGVALVDARYELGERKMWTTLIITHEKSTHEKSGWIISAIRNMLPAK